MPFVKGQSGNPKGRKPVGTTMAEYIRKIGGQNGEIYVDKLHQLATQPHDDARVRIMAIQVLVERGFGRPPQDVNVSGQLDSRTTVVHEYHDKPPAT